MPAALAAKASDGWQTELAPRVNTGPIQPVFVLVPAPMAAFSYSAPLVTPHSGGQLGTLVTVTREAPGGMVTCLPSPLSRHTALSYLSFSIRVAPALRVGHSIARAGPCWQ